MQKYKPKKMSKKKKNVDEYFIGETVVMVVLNGYGFESLSNQKIKKSFQSASQKSEICFAGRFLSDIVEEYREFPVSTEMVVIGIHKHVNFWN